MIFTTLIKLLVIAVLLIILRILFPSLVRGFKRIMSSRNLDNDVEDEVVKALADAVTGRFKDLSHRYYKLKSKWFNMDKLNWWDRNAPLPNKPNQKWS